MDQRKTGVCRSTRRIEDPMFAEQRRAKGLWTGSGVLPYTLGADAHLTIETIWFQAAKVESMYLKSLRFSSYSSFSYQYYRSNTSLSQGLGLKQGVESEEASAIGHFWLNNLDRSSCCASRFSSEPTHDHAASRSRYFVRCQTVLRSRVSVIMCILDIKLG